MDAFFAVTSNNTDFVKQLLIALSEELMLFEKTIKEVINVDEIEHFRKAAHKVLPGLKMLERTSLLNAIERYKEECNKSGQTVLNVSSAAHELRNEITLLLGDIRVFCGT